MMARSDPTNVALSAEPQANVLLLTLTDWMRIDARRLSPDRGHLSAR